MIQARAFSGRYFLGYGRQFNIGFYTPTVDTLYAIPFEAGLTVESILLLNKVGGSGDCVGRMGLYDCDAEGMPDALIEDVGESAFTTSTQGLRDFGLAEPLAMTEPFWVAMIFGGTTMPQVANCTMAGPELAMMFGNTSTEGSFFANSANAVSASQSYGALPSTFPPPSLSGCAAAAVLKAA